MRLSFRVGGKLVSASLCGERGGMSWLEVLSSQCGVCFRTAAPSTAADRISRAYLGFSTGSCSSASEHIDSET
jgi:hypothetical protein